MLNWFWKDSKLFVNIPLPGPRGRMYVSPMPWGPYDKYGVLMRTYRRHRITTVVMLVTDEEIARKARRDPLKLYASAKIEVIRFPIPDLTKPRYADVTWLVRNLRERLTKGERIAVHCNAGVGRTGTIAACVVCAVLNMDGGSAVEHIRQYMKIDLVDEQVQFVKKWGAQFGRQGVTEEMMATPIVELPVPETDTL